MIYSAKYKFIFLHNTRVAGTSIIEALTKVDPNVDSHEHMSSADTKEFLGDRIWNGSFKFAFVRNPYTWFMSGIHSSFSWEYPHEEYSFLIGDDKQIAIPIDGIVKTNHVVLRESLYQFFWQRWNKGGVKDDLFFDRHADQTMWASDDLDYIGRFESLQSDFDHICDKIGIQRCVLPQANPSIWTARSNIKLEYSEAAKNLVGILYADDIINFGYGSKG